MSGKLNLTHVKSSWGQGSRSIDGVREVRGHLVATSGERNVTTVSLIEQDQQAYSWCLQSFIRHAQTETSENSIMTCIVLSLTLEVGRQDADHYSTILFQSVILFLFLNI